MDAEKIVSELRGFKGRINQFESDDIVMEAAADLIERLVGLLTRPLSPAEIAKVFSDTDHGESDWEATDFGSIREVGGERVLTESEAGDVVRIYLMRGGSL